MIERVFQFFIENFPSWKEILIGGPIGFSWALFWLYAAGRCKRDRGWQTGYTRKIFHFAIFFSVAVIQSIWGTRIVCLFGGMTSLVVALAVVLGNGNVLYEAIAREKDEPYRTHFIIVPYFATLIGGLTGSIFFGELAIFGFLVTGFGDAVAEPVGTKFGRHEYSVISFRGVKSKRSLEGSLAVFLASIVAIIIGIFLSPEIQLLPKMAFKIVFLALAATATEAISPHGWDNTTMQIIPALLAKYLFLP